MRQIIQWLRRVYPPWWAIAVALVCYVLCEAMFWWTRLAFSVQTESLTELLRIRDSLMMMSCSAYAAFRVFVFHPLFRPKYRQWLEQTPWTSEQPLPLGPVYVTVQDVLLLGLMRLLLHDFQLAETGLPQAFLFAYLVAAVFGMWGAGERWLSYAVVFGLGLAIRLQWESPLVSLVCLGAFYLVSLVGLNRSLSRFPWGDSLEELNKHWREVQGSQAASQQATAKLEVALQPALLGWPYNLLNAVDFPTTTSRIDRLVMSLLAGWCMYAMVAMPVQHPVETIIMANLFIGYITASCVFGRLYAYCINHWPPISLWGRLWTGCWIIPRYDQVFVAPLLTAGVAIGGMVWLFRLAEADSLWLAQAAGGLFALILAITSLAGPSHRSWRLTMPCRVSYLIVGSSKHFERV
jgi:hypothetical protein